MNDAERAADLRSSIVREMVSMDINALNSVYLEALAIRDFGPMVTTEVLAAADAWYSTQGGTEEVERLRAAVVAMRGGA